MRQTAPGALQHDVRLRNKAEVNVSRGEGGCTSGPEPGGHKEEGEKKHSQLKALAFIRRGAIHKRVATDRGREALSQRVPPYLPRKL